MFANINLYYFQEGKTVLNAQQTHSIGQNLFKREEEKIILINKYCNLQGAG